MPTVTAWPRRGRSSSKGSTSRSAWRSLGDTFYVGNTDGVVAFPYDAGARRIAGPGRKLAEFKPGGHWTRSLLPSPDGASSTSASAR